MEVELYLYIDYLFNTAFKSKRLNKKSIFVQISIYTANCY